MRTVIAGVRPWRHDLAGCLHACAATLLRHAGVAPLEVLGSAWRFEYESGDFRREEYYFPGRPGESLLQSLAPYHPLRSSWHLPADPDQGWAQVRQQVAAGQPVAVAVDNFHLPFRPAYQDVHSNHLLIVYGFDDERGVVRVLDAVPPRFDGEITVGQLTAARGSGNQAAHERDLFFADQRIDHRWLQAHVDPDSALVLNRDTVRDVLRRNLDGFAAPSGTTTYSGLAGQAAFLRDIARRLADGEPVTDELFVVAGAVLAVTALHADWLGLAGQALGDHALVETSRHVERVAHHWSAVRILAALTRTGDVSVDRLRRRFRALMAAHEATLTELDDLVVTW